MRTEDNGPVVACLATVLSAWALLIMALGKARRASVE
jgi:hypothetical protein